MGLECRQEKITLQGKVGNKVGPGLGYREVKRWEEEAEYQKLGILDQVVGTGRGNVAHSVKAPGLPAFPSTTTSLSLGPLSFHPNTGPQGSHWAVTPGAGSILGGPQLPRGGGRYEATYTTNLRRSRDPEVANKPQSTWQERKHLGWLKVIIPSSPRT